MIEQPAGFDEQAYLAANPDVKAAVEAGAIRSGADHYARHGIAENRPLSARVGATPLELPPDFDERDYLAANPDVRAAVEAGAIPSGADHYARHGLAENRPLNTRARPAPLKLPFPEDANPSRRDKILANLDLKALDGMEIGALASPLVKPEEGNIFFVDHVDTKELREKYAKDVSVDVAKIVEVNAVWGRQTLQECIGACKKVDYVVASHVIEHTPDLVTWLAEIHSILRPGGSLRLAIPDRRYSFDYLRFETRLHDVLDAYIRLARAPLTRMIIEYFSLTRLVDCAAAWDGTLDVANLPRFSSARVGLEAARDALANGTYQDLHCWVFTPATFADLCAEMAELDLLGFACDYFFETPRDQLEFYVAMTPSDDKAAIIASWRRMREALLRSDTYQQEARTDGANSGERPGPSSIGRWTGARRAARGMREKLSSLKKHME